MITKVETWKTGIFHVTRDKDGNFIGKKPVKPIDIFERKLGSKEKVNSLMEKEIASIESALKRNKKVSTVFKSGITASTISLDKSNKKSISNAYKELFMPLLTDKSFLPRMVKGANKLKDNIFYRVTLDGYDKSDKFVTLATWNDFGKTIEELIIEYTETGIREQTLIDSTTLKEWKEDIGFTNLKGKGDGGIVTKIRIKAEFRYGRK